MDRCYVTCMEEGLARAATLVSDVCARNGFTAQYVGKSPGVIAMKPKLVLDPESFRMVNQTGRVPTLDDVMRYVDGRALYVYELTGENCDAVTQERRNQLGLKTYDHQRVHVTRNVAEMDIVDFAKTHDSRETATHILQNYTIDDLA